QKTHKLKRLVQSPNSYFMDVKCPKAKTLQELANIAQVALLASAEQQAKQTVDMLHRKQSLP
ncbi:hypothetical protein BGX23_005811, partial [Mortierella sp. AD031]